jgi:Spy/CpxP family protein refolding chaperone
MKAIAAALIAMSMSLAVPAWAQSGKGAQDDDAMGSGEPGEARHEGGHGRWLEKLGLTPDQKTKINDIRQKKRAAAETHKAELERLNEELKKVLAGDGPADKARELHQKVQEEQRQLADIFFESTLAVREVLTSEQRVRFVETMKFRKVRSFGK